MRSMGGIGSAGWDCLTPVLIMMNGAVIGRMRLMVWLLVMMHL